ncbi:uncharacterized protein LOC134528923 [Bacillus rossius redtenbacheri]|uniref:uncharacterized protein LOC134528923 n=1 Tax=Bacillus rossius redtenbacheri TaxID=93214 RepID=UPI002FDCF5ED
MVRHYVRKRGSRQYKNYSEKNLEKALNEVRAKKISVRAAAEKYGIHRNTLSGKIHGKHPNASGGQTTFSSDEEGLFAKYIIAMSTYGFPLTAFDLQMTVKNYLDKCGRHVKKFKNNVPGRDWVESFLKRHKQDLSTRLARNISHARARSDEGTINTFFDNFSKEVEGVPHSNIWNFDESNLVDDPGCKKVIVKKGTKYPEKIRNATKACTTIMLCGNAEGILAHIYINYKAENLWQTWTEGGPDGAHYNRTRSGWFDAACFEDWFTKLMLPILKQQPGKKIIMGDNLSAHLNIEVLNLCEKYNISFILLPPNATHLLQPLDVAYFRSMKGEWRKILSEWKETSYGSRCATIPKDQFPHLLKTLLDNLAVRGQQNLKSGFKKCGLVPLDRNKVLAKLCDSVMKEVTDADNSPTLRISDSFLEELKKRRHEEVKTHGKTRRRKLTVPPGKSVCANDLSSNAYENEPSTSQPKTGRKNQKQKTRDQQDTSSSDIEDDVQYDDTDASVEDLIESDSESNDSNGRVVVTDTLASSVCDSLSKDLSIGDFVAFLYDDIVYPGTVTAIDESDVKISAMSRTGKYWKWPEKKDEIWYKKTAVIKMLPHPKQLSLGGSKKMNRLCLPM